jgi:hypothetical protein
LLAIPGASDRIRVWQPGCGKNRRILYRFDGPQPHRPRRTRPDPRGPRSASLAGCGRLSLARPKLIFFIDGQPREAHKPITKQASACCLIGRGHGSRNWIAVPAVRALVRDRRCPALGAAADGRGSPHPTGRRARRFRRPLRVRSKTRHWQCSCRKGAACYRSILLRTVSAQASGVQEPACAARSALP